MRHLFIINKNAGKNKKNLPVLEKIEKQQGDNVVIRYTEKAQDATDIAREFVSESDEFVRVETPLKLNDSVADLTGKRRTFAILSV